MDAAKLPALFKGATHRLAGSGEPVKAVHWVKDGDHELVVRYPVERRHFKGLLVVSEKEKYALRFGDWVIEDAQGRIWVEGGQAREVVEMVEDAPAGSGVYRKVTRKLPSQFEEKYRPIGGESAAAVATVLVAVLGLLFGEPQDLPILFGVTHLMYYSALLGQWNGLANAVFDLDTDTIKVAAATNTYVPNQDTHDFFDDMTNEVTGTNYTAGGATLASVTLVRATTTVTFDAADVVWTQSASGFSTARKFPIYRSTGVAATSRLFSVVTADADVGNVTGDLTIAWNAAGIATWSTT